MDLSLALVDSSTVKKELKHQVKQALVGTAPRQQLLFGLLKTLVAFLVTSFQETLSRDEVGA